MNALKRINEALPALVVGILLYGLLAEAVTIWFVEDKINWSIGLGVGILCAVGMAIHLAIVIDDSVRLGNSARVLAAKSVLRYIVIAVVFFAMAISGIGDVISAFVGVMGLKFAAYAQPKVDAFFFKNNKTNDIQDNQE